MKKNLLLLASMVAVVTACSKSDSGEDKKEPAPVVQQEKVFKAEIKETFSDSRHTSENVLVGELIPYEIEITDSDTNENTKYNLIFAKKEGSRHQTEGVDYEVYIDKEGTQKMSEERLQFSSAGKHKFYIKPLLPGSFFHKYELQKTVNGQPVLQDNLTKELLFTAVKISAWYKSVETQEAGFFQHSKHKNEFFFKVEDGEEETDNYLTKRINPNINYSYRFEYDNKVYQGELEIDKEIKCTESGEKEVSAPEVTNKIINRIAFTRKQEGRQDEKMEYYNIILTKKTK